MPADDAQGRRALADQIEKRFNAGSRYIVIEPHEVPLVVAALRTAATPDNREAERARAAAEMREACVKAVSAEMNGWKSHLDGGGEVAPQEAESAIVALRAARARLRALPTPEAARPAEVGR